MKVSDLDKMIWNTGQEKRLHEAAVKRANALLRMWNESKEAERLWHRRHSFLCLRWHHLPNLPLCSVLSQSNCALWVYTLSSLNLWSSTSASAYLAYQMHLVSWNYWNRERSVKLSHSSWLYIGCQQMSYINLELMTGCGELLTFLQLI